MTPGATLWPAATPHRRALPPSAAPRPSFNIWANAYAATLDRVFRTLELNRCYAVGNPRETPRASWLRHSVLDGRRTQRDFRVMARFGLTAILLWVITTVLPSGAQPSQEPSEALEANAAADAEPTEGKPGGSNGKANGEQTFAEIIKDKEVIDGLFRFYRDPDDNTALIEIKPDQFDTEYIYGSTIDQATGERGLYGGFMDMGNNFVVQWKRLGKRVQLVRKNLRFRAALGNPVSRAIKNSFSDSVLGSGKILGLPNDVTGAVLVDLHEVFFAREFAEITKQLKDNYETEYSFDKSDSGIVLLKSFPRNSEIGILMQFSAKEQKVPSVTLPNSLSLALHLRYSFVALPEESFRPRLGDDRIGHFYDMHMDFTSDKPDTPYIRYVRRWNLKKRNSGLNISEPQQPIVFWLENTIPVEYRDWIRDGILMWNAAFERIGFKDALVVRQQPADADWDFADIRYNTVRWFVTYDRSFAIGPSHSNPYTGQQIDADISISESAIRLAARRRYEQTIHPIKESDRFGTTQATPSIPARAIMRSNQCDAGSAVLDRATLGFEILSARPGWDAVDEERFTRQWIQWLVAHEVGHTLGLRHNFRASAANRLDQLSDEERLSTVGLAASMMDYVPPVVALPGEEQKDYFQQHVGSYDYWAIEYSYKEIPGADTPQDELPELQEIASRVADPTLSYATDEDASQTARGLDPRDNKMDLTSEPLDWYRRSFQLINELWMRMNSRILRDGESYAILRRAFDYTWSYYRDAAYVAMKYVGGIYHNRDHSGDSGGRIPFRPVPAQEQRQALEFLSNEVWAGEVFNVPADLLAKLQFERFPDFEGREFSAKRLDYPLHERVLRVQARVLDELYSPVKLSRFQDLELLQASGDQFSMADAFIGVRESIWSELDEQSAINSFRRNLQSEHLRHLVNLVTKPPAQMPRDAVALARSDLSHIRTGIDRTLRSDKLDYTTRAYLEDALIRIRQALEARLEP